MQAPNDQGNAPDFSAKKAEYRELPCKLDEAELRHRGENLAILQGDLENVAGLNARAKATWARMEALAKELRSRLALRSIEVRELLQAESSEVATIRVDTGEVISRRKMTEDEKQRSLFDRGPVDMGAVTAGPSSDDAPQLGQVDKDAT